MSVAIQNEPAAPGKLIVAPTEAAQWVLAQLEKGHAIRKLKLRYAEDLEKAREKKGEWVKQTNDLLKGMFDTESIAQEFNTWEVRVLPEYAELSLFIDVFYEEMDQRLMRLTSVHRRIPAGPGSNGAPAPTAIVAPPTAASASIAPRNVARTSSVRHTSSATSTDGTPSPVSSSDGQGSCLLILHGESGTVGDRVSQFVSRLDFEPIRVESKGDNAATFESLDQNPNVAFAIIVLDAHTAASAKPGSTGMTNGRLLFQLGYCVGKLGLRRICVLMPDSGASFCDDHGVLYVPLDAADGWQLQVARQLKRSGIEIDLNRMC